MTKRILVHIMTAAIAVGLFCALTLAADSNYQDYRQSNGFAELFRIVYHEDDISIHFREGDKEHSSRYARRDIVTKDGVVRVGAETIFDKNGLIIDGVRRNYEEIVDVTILDAGDFFSITFLTAVGESRRVDRLRKGNRISFDRTLVVEEDEFVRGLVLSIIGNVEVYGEINKDVVSLFGDVYIGPAGVARGDVTSLTGDVDVARDASVYGEIYTHDKKRVTQRHRFRRRMDRFDMAGEFFYNRVDGLLFGLGGIFEDPDSLLPTIWMDGAYAFASERWRYDFGLEQTLLRSPALAIGGELYRHLVSEDDWLLGNDENTAFALLVGEDYKDYYEAEGGWAYTRFRPFNDLLLQVGYTYEETKWLGAHHNLWHLFGSRKFGDNYETVDTSFGTALVTELDSSTNGYLTVELEYDTGDPDERFASSSWKVSTALEYAHPDFSSDFEYRRYTLALTRFQEVHRRSMLIVRGMYGGSDGYLPIHKRYFLGGLGTMRGYRHKEYMGTRFWLVNTEYRTRFPGSDISASLIWDMGKIGNDTALDGDVDLKHSLGFALALGDDFRISIAKRLDRSDDNDPRIYVRFTQPF